MLPRERRPRWSRRVGVGVVVAGVVTTVACAGPPSRVGAKADPVVLRTLGVEGVGVPADLVRQLVLDTGGAAVALRADLPALPATEDTDDAALTALRDDRVDVAVVRADALVDAGATSLAPLQLPLIHSEPAARAVAERPVAGSLMATLPKAGLVGLALVPNGLRHPVSYGYVPLRSPGDYLGGIVNARRGPGGEAIIKALGATPDHSSGEQRAAKVSGGVLRAIDTSARMSGDVDGAAVITSNVTLYVQFDVVVVRRAAYTALTSSQRDSLAAAVSAAVARSWQVTDTEAQVLRRWCDEGRQSWLASPEGVAGFARALAPVVDRARSDPSLRPLVESVAAVDSGFPPAPGMSCHPDVGPHGFAPRGNQRVLDGVWRLELRAQALVDAGLPVDQNVGIWTFTVRNGLATVDQPSGPDCVSQFTFDGERLSLDWSADGASLCQGFLVGTYRRSGDTLQIRWQEDPSSSDHRFDAAMWSFGLHRIGDG